MSDWLREAKELFSYTKSVRRLLHENPELTSREFKTVAFIRKELEKEEIPYENIPDGGVLAWLDGTKNQLDGTENQLDGTENQLDGKEVHGKESGHISAQPSIGDESYQTVLLRDDCDALPIQESRMNAAFPKE